MKENFFLAAWLLLSSGGPVAAQTSLGWPETIELLAQQRTQAETCASGSNLTPDALV